MKIIFINLVLQSFASAANQVFSTLLLNWSNPHPKGQHLVTQKFCVYYTILSLLILLSNMLAECPSNPLPHAFYSNSRKTVQNHNKIVCITD